jgi:RNA polymerase sigma-70 factor (ECF subfamily)
MAKLIAVHSSDGELLARTVGGDAKAFGLFYDRFEREMLAFLVRATGRAEIAADLCAEVFTQALSSAQSFRPELGSARAWLYGIARHELADAFHRGRVEDQTRRRLEIEALVLDDATLTEIEALAGEDAAPEMLHTLPADQRAAVAGRVLEERGYNELAVSLQCSPSVARQRVSRGLRTLRGRLERTQ